MTRRQLGPRASRSIVKLGSLVAVASLLSSCSAEVADGPADVAAEADVGSSAAALTNLPLGAVPIPVSAVTKKKVWDGTYPELLAADALAECTLTHFVSVTEGGVDDGDSFLQSLSKDMGKALCDENGPPPNPAPPAETLFLSWIVGRQKPACNVDPQSNEPKGMDNQFAMKWGTESPYGLPLTSTYQAGTPAPAFSGAELNQARSRAQNQVHYAWLNLCMAQKLNEHLESIQVAFASESDLLQLQSFIRERAARAVFQYSTIIKTINGSTPSTAISTPWFYPTLIRYWPQKEGLAWTGPQGKGQRIGQDFALAVQLLVDVSQQHTETLLRASSTKPGFGSYDSTPPDLAMLGALDSGLDGARLDALAAAYGQTSNVSRRGVVTDMEAPEVGVLLGLARLGNALHVVGASMTFNLQTNATAMYDNVERVVRSLDCQRRGDVTTACYQIPAGTPTDQYFLRKRYNIQPAHATTLVKAILEHLYGQPGRDSYTADGPWMYKFDAQDIQLGLPQDFLERFPGTHNTTITPGFHTYTGDFSSAGGGALRINSNAPITQLSLARMQSQAWSVLPALGTDGMHPSDQGYGLRAEANGYARYGRELLGLPIGTQNVLAYARFVASRANANASEIITGAGPKLWTLLETALGARSAVIRRQVGTTTGTNMVDCSAWAYNATGTNQFISPSSCTRATDVTNASGVLMDVWVNTRSTTDPFTRIQRRTITNPAILPAPVTPISATVETAPAAISAVTGETLRRFANIAIPATDVADLRLLDASNRELPLFRGRLQAPVAYNGSINATFMPPQLFQRASTFARSTSYGGTLNRQIERAWEFQENEWGKPRYDGLDLPTDWAPVGDASLHGGQAGEEAYQYFLRQAAGAAKEASSAIENAFERLSIESEDTLALAQASEKGKSLNELEERSLCGDAAAGESNVQGACTPTFANTVIAVPNCPGGVGGACGAMRYELGMLLGTAITSSPGMALPSDVVTQRTNTVGNFSKYAGGQIEGQLLAQWSALKALEAALKTAVDTSAAQEAEIQAANAERTASDAQFDVDMVNALVNLANAFAAGSAARANITALTTERMTLSTNLGIAERESKQECSPAAYDVARGSGYSFSGRNRNPTVDPNTGAWEVPASSASDGGSRSWSPAAVEAQKQKCAQGQESYRDQLAQQAPLNASIQGRIDAAKAAIDAANLSAWALFPAQLRAAIERRKVAPARVAAVQMQAQAAIATQLQLVQQAFGDLLAAGIGISAGGNQAKLAKARIDLDTQLGKAVLENRFNLRRLYRSYDLWRARALSENARRLAVAARRAIEARFVVDLSDLEAPETFVEAPALWADEIFAPDLKPPAAVGRTAAPGDTSGLYSSRLVDYVNNLELFVNGYAIGRPTAVVRSDTDVVQLPGPAAVSEVVGSDGTVYDFRSTDASAWSFFCAGTGTWVSHPQSAAFNPASWTLATMCGGKPPTLARLPFWLDPWGRPLGVPSDPPYNARHNARWNSFAINLVGSGVRDCSAAKDPSACYAEPFIRFALKHVGPALVSDFDQSWLSMDIPTGMVEGGKALASEEWLDPVANGFQNPVVGNVARQELAGRPLGGAYELVLELTPDVRPERIERIQVLVRSDYWVRQK